MTTRKKTQWWPIVRTLLLSIAAGSGMGVVAAVWTSSMLSHYATSLQLAQHLPSITTTDPTPVPGTYEEALSRVREHAKTSLALFFTASSDSGVPSSWFVDQDALAYGVVVSDDGWIACDIGAFDDVDDIADLDVWIERVRYRVTDVVRDDATGVVMVRVDGRNFASIDFAATDNVASGTMMFAVTDEVVIPTAVVHADDVVAKGVQAAEIFTTTWRLSTSSAMSLPLLNAAGNLAGFTQAGEVTATPLHHGLAMIRDVVKSGNVTAPALGAYGVDLSTTFAIASSVRQDLRAGFLIVAPKSTVKAIVTGGPADVGGLALGDVILAVDGETLSATSTLAELLASYDVGTTARLTVYRGGETIMIPVTLGDQASVIY